MAAMIARVMLAVAAAVGLCLYAVVLAAAAVPMLILTALRFASRLSKPAPPVRFQVDLAAL